jgi:membrane protein YdbS with pleckstrin-like domain
MGEQAQAEAWVRKKPRRTIHNQTLIQLLAIACGVGSIWLGGFIFWLVFGVAPAIVVPSILAVWAVGSVSYIVMRLHVERQNKKS